MARFALVDASEGTVLAVRAALGAEAVETCRRGAVPAGAPLVIVEAVSKPVRDDFGAAGPLVPVLVLFDRTTRPSIELGARRFDVLGKPFGAADLRQKIRVLLESASAAQPLAGGSPWLAEPLLEAPVAAALASAGSVDGAVWIVGEAGTGADLVAAAFAVAWDAGRAPVAWEDTESLADAASRLGDASRVLWVPAIDERPLGEQRAFERFLALEPGRRVVVTSADDPERAVASGIFAPSLAARLSRISVRLAPLRERGRDVTALAVSFGSAVAQRCGRAEGVSLSERAVRALEAYDWPGNLVEIEAVLTRSVLAKPATSPADKPAAEKNRDPSPIPGNRGRIPILELDDLLFAPGHLAPLLPSDDATEHTAATEPASAPRRAVVVALGDVAAARAASTASVSAAEEPAREGLSRQPDVSNEDSGVEAMLAGFAHDLRNPMSTIKTFTGLEAARAGSDSSELAALAAEACEQVDQQLELLQRYSQISPSAPVVVDLVELLGEAAEAALDHSLAIAARKALPVRSDPALARFVAAAIVGECEARRSPMAGEAGAVADLAPGPGPGATALVITIPTGGAAVDRLGKWVAGERPPWRLALARDAARRAGGALDVEVEDGQLRLTWRLPQAVMDVEGSQKGHDEQADSPDRRRRSRGS